jgi:hypothetical protein
VIASSVGASSPTGGLGIDKSTAGPKGMVM